jgi:hypothetical protein
MLDIDRSKRVRLERGDVVSVFGFLPSRLFLTKNTPIAP